MLPFLKKNKQQASSQPLVPPWHPNFRNYDRLPDTKVVRTTFFINGMSVFMAIVLLLAFVYQEYKLKTLGEQVVNWDEQIEKDRQPSAAAVALFKQFQAEERIINEVATFVDGRLVVSDFVLRLGEILPANIAIRGFEFRDTGVILRGISRGTPDEASGYATGFVEQLRRDPVFTEIFGTDVSQTAVNRDPSGNLNFELMLRFKPAPAKK